MVRGPPGSAEGGAKVAVGMGIGVEVAVASTIAVDVNVACGVSDGINGALGSGISCEQETRRNDIIKIILFIDTL